MNAARNYEIGSQFLENARSAVGIHRSESGKPPPLRDAEPCRPKYLQNELVARQYEAIGEALAVCEAGSIDAGIAILPPTPARIRLGAKFEGPVSEYLRMTLVTVSTKTLECYCDDLEHMPPDAHSAELMNIPVPALWERFFLPALSFVLLFLAFIFSASAAGTSYAGYLIAAVAAAVGGGLCAGMCLEQQRRRNFYTHLYNELLRRRGLDQAGLRSVKLLSVETDSIE